MSDFFIEHRYFKFQNEIQFFSYYNNGTLKHRDSESFRGCNRPIRLSCFFQLLHHITCTPCRSLLMSCHNIILPFSLTYLSSWAPNARCLVADHAYAGFSNDRRCCRSVAQTSALLRGNKWTSLRIFAVTLRLELN